MKINNVIIIFLMMFLVSCGENSSTDTPGGGTDSEPGIAVKRFSTAIFSGGGPYPFGNVIAGFSSNPVPFSIENTGGGELVISSIEISGVNPEAFSHNFSGEKIILSEDTSGFEVIFSPQSSAFEGLMYAQLNITHNDPSGVENPFIVLLAGNVVTRIAEINVRCGNSNVFPGGLVNFGTVANGAVSQKVFTVENKGSGVLTLTGTPPDYVLKSGADAADFTLTQPAGAVIEPGESIDFTVSVMSVNPGSRTADISIASDDPDEADYAFSLSAYILSAPAPRITVEDSRGFTLLNDNDGPVYMYEAFDYGDVNTGGGLVKTFTIRNAGNAELTLFSITDYDGNDPFVPGDFILDDSLTSFTLASGAFTTFNVEFSPLFAGSLSEMIRIASNDAASGDYVFEITGRGVEAEMEVSPLSWAFADTITGQQSTEKIFIIMNTGTAALEVSGINVTLSVADFTVYAPTLPFYVSPGSSAFFTCVFNPASPGLINGTISITCNDPLSPVDISVSGTGIEPAPVFEITPDYYHFGNVEQLASAGPVPFTIENRGNSPLAIDGISVIAGAAHFSADASHITFSHVLAPGGKVSFGIVFAPSGSGLLSGSVRVSTAELGNIDLIVDGTGGANPSPACRIMPSYYNFGSVEQSASSSWIPFTVENTGNASLEINGISVFSGAAYFFLDANHLAFSELLVPGGILSFFVSFSPSLHGALNGTVRIETAELGPQDLQLSGTGGADPAPAFRIVPASFDFGNVDALENSSWVPFTIDNTGSAPLTVTGISLSAGDVGEFVLNTSPLSFNEILAPGDMIVFYVSFQPSAGGIFSADISIAMTEIADETLTVSGTGIALPVYAVYPTYHDFGTIAVSASGSPVPFTVCNHGNADMNVTGIAVTLSPADFSVDADHLAPAEILIPGECLSFTAVFHPVSTGVLNGEITVSITEVAVGDRVIFIDGEGI